MASYFALLIVILSICTGIYNASYECDKDVQLSYLNGAMYVLAKAKYDHPGLPRDCSDLIHMGRHQSGVYTVWPLNRLFEGKPVEVYCDMETSGGGWTVIQRRGNFFNPQDFFFRDWNSYKQGFGDLKKEFWLGNDKIYALTSQKNYSLRVDLKDMEENIAFASYETFWIDDENHKYMLHVHGYLGDAGDSLGSYHDNQKFTTKDQQNDNNGKENCAELYKGGWWFNKCHISNLNGLNLRGNHKTYGNGINWNTWRGYKESLGLTAMMIRPNNFKKLNYP